MIRSLATISRYMQSKFDTMPVFQRPAAYSLPPSRKSKLRPTGGQSDPPPNQASFYFWTAKAWNTRSGVAFQWRVMVKLACTTERAVMGGSFQERMVA